MFKEARELIATIREKDPAAHGAAEIIFAYPGFHAVMIHRFAHWCAIQGWTAFARWVSQVGRFLTGIEIHPKAKIGRRVFFDHAMGVVIGETAEVGDDCTIYQGVTLGGTNLTAGAKRHPTLENGVVVGAGAKVLGSFTVGAGAQIGSNAVVVKDVSRFLKRRRRKPQSLAASRSASAAFTRQRPLSMHTVSNPACATRMPPLFLSLCVLLKPSSVKLPV